VSRVATVERADGSRARVLVSDMSYEGCRFLAEQAFEQGECVTFTMPQMGSIEAQVRWVSGDCVGLRFLLGQNMLEARRARLGV
jgi:hypothetical protein